MPRFVINPAEFALRIFERWLSLSSARKLSPDNSSTPRRVGGGAAFGEPYKTPRFL